MSLNHFVNGAYDMFDQYRLNINEPSHALTNRIAIVGFADVGKKALCNSLWGWQAVKPSNETTRNFGLITLIDLPTDPYDVSSIMYRLENYELIIYVLDGEKGLDSENFNWIARLRSLRAAMIIAVNKAERIPEEKLQPALEFLELRTARPVVPLNSTNTELMRSSLLSAVLQVCPELAVPLATEIVSLRKTVALYVIMQAVMNSLSLNFEAHNRQDTSVLVGLQLRLIQEIAEIYGYREQTGVKQRVGLSFALRITFNKLISQIAYWQQIDERISFGIMSSTSTYLIGRCAMIIYGGSLPRWLMKLTPQSWRTQTSHGKSDGNR